jgi:hypothetical protein
MPLRRPRAIHVPVGDLLLACPSQQTLSGSVEDRFDLWHRLFDLRRQWSHQELWIDPPICFEHLPKDEIQLQHRMLCYHMCRSNAFWKVVGPPELTAALASIPAALWGNPGASIYLCQHEVIGD